MVDKCIEGNVFEMNVIIACFRNDNIEADYGTDIILDCR